MRSARSARRILVLFSLLAVTPVYAGDAEESPTFGELLQVTNLLDNAGMSRPAEAGKPTLLNVDKQVKKILSDPVAVDIINRVIKKEVLRDDGWLFLRDIDFKFKIFDATDDGTPLSGGFAYAYEKDIRDHEFQVKGLDYADLDLSFSSRGNVAFDSDVNPEDFLDTKINFGFYGSHGGTRGPMTPEDHERYITLTQELSNLSTAELRTSPKKQELLKLARSYLTNQVGFDLGGKVAFETDQTFSHRQMVYGGELGLVVSGWERFDATTWNETSTLAKFNLVDYPFAVIRWATGFDQGFAPRGLNFPAGRTGIGLVDPQNDDPRAAFGDHSSFPRVDAEVSFRTPVVDASNLLHLSGGNLLDNLKLILDVIYVSADYRYYREIGASNAVKSANLAEFNYVVATVGSTSGPFFSYLDGHLPFDRTSDQIYEVGYKFHF
jgi:hypothetical protein